MNSIIQQQKENMPPLFITVENTYGNETPSASCPVNVT